MLTDGVAKSEAMELASQRGGTCKTAHSGRPHSGPISLIKSARVIGEPSEVATRATALPYQWRA